MKIVSESVSSTIGETLVKTTVIDDDGVHHQKILQIDDYLQLWKGSSYIKQESMDIGIMPRSLVDLKYGDSENYSATLVFPKKKRQYSVAGGKVYNIPYPTMLYMVKIADGRFLSSQLFAIKGDGEILSNDTELYRYPFGNVSASGSICYGNAAHSVIKSISEVENLFYDFLCAQTNGHYYEPLKSNLADFKSQEALVEWLATQDEFPDELLAPLQVVENYKSQVEKFFLRQYN